MPNAVITFALTIAHLSPEAVLRQEFGKPMDIWSVGCVVVEMATGKVSYIHIYIYIYIYILQPLCPCTYSIYSVKYIAICKCHVIINGYCAAVGCL